MIALDVRRETAGWEWEFEVHAPWGFLGWITPTLQDDRPLARPVPVWPIWLAVWTAAASTRRDSDELAVYGTAAVSGAAAQLQLLRKTGATDVAPGDSAQTGGSPRPRVVEPWWGVHVRDLNGEDLVESAKAAGWAKVAGRDIGETLLTPWEIEHLEPADNPVAAHYDRLRGRDGSERADAWVMGHEASQMRPRTPAGLRLMTVQSTTDPEHDRWSLGQVAAFLEVGVSTVQSWRARGRLPAEDGTTGRNPWWYSATIRRWHQNRPGQGARTDL